MLNPGCCCSLVTAVKQSGRKLAQGGKCALAQVTCFLRSVTVRYLNTPKYVRLEVRRGRRFVVTDRTKSKPRHLSVLCVVIFVPCLVKMCQVTRAYIVVVSASLYLKIRLKCFSNSCGYQGSL